MDKHIKVAEFISMLIEDGEYDVAIESAEAYLHKLSHDDTGFESISYSFENMEEFLYYAVSEKERRDAANELGANVNWVNTQASAVSRLQSYALIELGRHDEAITVLKHALDEINPVGILLRFELVEAYLANNQLHLAENELSTLSAMVVTPPDIAKYYRRLGYCMAEREAYADARVCILYSLCFEKNVSAMGELAFLDDQLGNPWDYENIQGKMDLLTTASRLRLYEARAKEYNLAFTPTKTQKDFVLLLVDAYAKAGKTDEMRKWADTHKQWADYSDEDEAVFEIIKNASSILH